MAVSCCLTASAFCQGPTPGAFDMQTATDLLPPSPNAASLGRYGGTQIGIASGTVQQRVDLVTLGSSKLNVPVYLTYASNGVKVDEIASRVGMSWNLQAGGVITRTVYGDPDELRSRVGPINYTVHNRAFVNVMESLVHVNGGLSAVDGEPDVFTFSFQGYSGRFILDSSLQPVLLTHNGLDIVRNSATSFTIRTPDGITYRFGGTGAVESVVKTSSGCGKTFNSNVNTAFYLREIAHPNGDVITFSYTSVTYGYKAGIDANISKRRTGMTSPCTISAPGSDNTTCVNSYTTTTPLLQEISSARFGKITFQYSNRLDLGDKLLTGVKAFEPNATTAFRSFTLEYIQQKATQFMNRSSLVSSDQTLLYRPFLTKVTERDVNNAVGRKFQFAYYNISTLPPRLSYAQDHYGYFNGKTNTNFYAKPASTEWRQVIPEATANRDLDAAYAKAGLLSSIVYPTGAKDSIIYEGNTEWAQANNPAAGMRVAKVLTVDGSVTALQKKYTYASLANPTRSSGIGLYKPIYERAYSVRIPCSAGGLPCELGEAFYFSIGSNSRDNIYAFTDAPTYYTHVVVEDVGANGGTEYQFDVVKDALGQHILGSMPNTPLTRNSDVNGLETSRFIFKRSGATIVPVQQVFTHHRIDTRVNNEIPAYVVRKKYTVTCQYNPPNQDEIESYDFFIYHHRQRWVYVDTIRTRIYDVAGSSYNETLQVLAYDNTVHAQVSRAQITNSDGSKETTYTTYPHDYANTSGAIQQMKSNHLAAYPIEQVKYKEVGSTRTILSGRITTYRTGGQGRIDQVLELETGAPLAQTGFKFSNRGMGVLPPSGSATNYSADGGYKVRLTYNDYDAKGNPLQVTAVGGLVTSYVWGYGGQYLVAEVRNATRAAVTGTGFSQTVLDNVNSTETQISNQLNAIRTHTSLRGAHMTTYTYKPIYGMSSSTDVSGYTTRYDYDSFGRLWRVRDHQGNIIEDYKYNYRH